MYFTSSYLGRCRRERHLGSKQTKNTRKEKEKKERKEKKTQQVTREKNILT